jgi:hypothetical protein
MAGRLCGSRRSGGRVAARRELAVGRAEGQATNERFVASSSCEEVCAAGLLECSAVKITRKGDASMVRSIKLTGLAFMAVLALGAVAASSASATALIKFTANGAFTSDQISSSIIQETKEGGQMTCTKFPSKGTITGEDKLHVLIEYEKCTGPSGTTCTTTEGGSEVGTSGNIHVLALELLGSDAAPPLDLPAILITTENKSGVPANVTYKCQVFGIGTEITEEGSIIALVSNLTSVNPGILLHLTKSGVGSQQDSHFWDESKTNALALLLVTGAGTGGFAKQEGSKEASALLLSTGTPITLIEVK